jgi:hypothetical protein
MKRKRKLPEAEQLAIQFYSDELVAKEPKVGDVILIQQYKFSTKYKRGEDVIIPTLIVTQKELYSTNKDWRYIGRGVINIMDLCTAKHRWRSYNKYITTNKARYGGCTTFTYLSRATKKNTKPGDKIVEISRFRSIYETTEGIYNGQMKLTGFFKL